MDLYETLGLEKNATSQEIKKQFKKLAQKHHPDKGGDKELYQQLVLARDILSDENRRRLYDESGQIHKQPDLFALAAQGLSEIFVELINNPECNFVNTAKIIIEKKLAVLTQELKQQIKTEKELSKLLKRVTSETDHNLFVGVLTQKLDGVNNNKLNLEKNIAVGNEMLKMLEDYNDAFVEQPTTHMYSTFSFGTATT